jgi:cupin fold WbuC family metalloprotein
MNFTEVNNEVFYTCEPITRVTGRDIEFLKKKAATNPRKRVRLCSHPNIEDFLHEMLLVHSKGNYIRPHKHINKSESLHIVEGEMRVFIFDESGNIQDIINMSPYNPMKPFYCRLSKSVYHTMTIISDFVVFHETINGPFKREDNVDALWSPNEDDNEAKENYIKKLLSMK